MPAKSSEAQSRTKKLEKMPILEPPETEYRVKFKFPDVEKLSPPICRLSSRCPKSLSDRYTKNNIVISYSETSTWTLNSNIESVSSSLGALVRANDGLKLLIGKLSPTSGLITQHPRLRIGFFDQRHADARRSHHLTTSAVACQLHGKESSRQDR
jgi:ATP-binding cassette subfamily F protein 3